MKIIAFFAVSCCAGEQMLNTRCSDPNFYSVASANDPIIKQMVDNYTGAKLICDTTRLTSVPRNIFHVPSQKYGVFRLYSFLLSI